MSDAIDDLRAVKEMEKAQRLEAWVGRFIEIGKIESAGFQVHTVSEIARHCRIILAGNRTGARAASAASAAKEPTP